MTWEITFIADLDTITICVTGNTLIQIDTETLMIDHVKVTLPYCEIRQCVRQINHAN